MMLARLASRWLLVIARIRRVNSTRTIVVERHHRWRTSSPGHALQLHPGPATASFRRRVVPAHFPSGMSGSDH